MIKRLYVNTSHRKPSEKRIVRIDMCSVRPINEHKFSIKIVYLYLLETLTLFIIILAVLLSAPGRGLRRWRGWWRCCRGSSCTGRRSSTVQYRTAQYSTVQYLVAEAVLLLARREAPVDAAPGALAPLQAHRAAELKQSATYTATTGCLYKLSQTNLV